MEAKPFYPPETFNACIELAKQAPLLCAKYYALYDLVKNKNAQQLEFDLELLSKQLDYAFQRYILYACARESRHIYSRDVFDWSSGPYIKPEVDNIADRLASFSQREIRDPCCVAEEIFKVIENTKQSVLDYLKGLEELFQLGDYWAPNYGGPSWAGIAALLIKRLQAKYSTLHIFIDSCWHAQHNTRCFLDKLIYVYHPAHAHAIHGLQDILNAKAEGDLTYVAHCAYLPKHIITKYYGARVKWP